MSAPVSRFSTATMASRSDSGYGKGLTRAEWTSVNIATVGPMPSASVRTAAIDTRGERLSARSAVRTSARVERMAPTFRIPAVNVNRGPSTPSPSPRGSGPFFALH